MHQKTFRFQRSPFLDAFSILSAISLAGAAPSGSFLNVFLLVLQSLPRNRRRALCRFRQGLPFLLLGIEAGEPEAYNSSTSAPARLPVLETSTECSHRPRSPSTQQKAGALVLAAQKLKAGCKQPTEVRAFLGISWHFLAFLGITRLSSPQTGTTLRPTFQVADFAEEDAGCPI